MNHRHAFGILGLVAPALAARVLAADPTAPADFTVDPYVVAPSPQRFGVNLRDPSELNSFTLDPGFEPTTVRRQHTATGGGADYIENRPIQGPPTWSPGTWHYQTMADGFFDGATVRVYRVSTNGGPLQFIRRAVVTNYVTDGFRRLHVMPIATNRFVDASGVPGVACEYQVRAVDAASNVSTNWGDWGTVTGSPLAGVASMATNPAWTGTHYPRGDSVRPAVPSGIVVTPLPGAVQLDWARNTESDLAGYNVYRRTIPTNERWRVLLDGTGAVVRAGDIYFLDMVADNPPTHRMHDRLGVDRFTDAWRVRCGASWPYSLPGVVVRDPSTVAPTNGGRTSLRIENPGTHDVAIYQPRFSSPDYNGGFYPNLTPGVRYRFSVWMKQSGLASPVRLSLSQHYASASNSFSVATNWQHYTYTFVAGALPTNGGISEIALAVRGPGTLWVDNLLLYEDDDGDPETYPAFAMRPAARQALIDYRPGVLRSFSATDMAYWGVTVDDCTRAEPEVGMHWHSDTGKHVPDDPYQLPTALAMARDVGGEPWLVVGSFFSETEWQDLIEYLAAPYDPLVDTPQAKPFAARRYAQGQTTPWTEALPRIYIEYGDELWNPIFQWQFADGNQNGQFAEHFISGAMTSRYMTASALGCLRFMVDGWMIQPDALTGYGHAASRLAPHASHNTVATYIGGWEAGVAIGGPTVNDAGFQDYMMYAPQVIFGFMNQHAASRDANAAAGHAYDVALYEGGPGYANPSPGTPYDPVSEVYGKSLAAGVATLDTFLYDSYLRIEPQAYFAFGGQYNWASHSFIANGYSPHTTWQALQLRNRYASGSMLATAIHSAPTLDVAARTNAAGAELAPATANVPLIQPYAFRDGARYAIFVLSRRLDGATPVTMRLPFTSVTNATLYRLEGDPRSGNSSNLMVTVASEPVTNAGPVFSFAMPPGTVYLFVFDGAAAAPVPERPRARVSRAPGQAAVAAKPAARFAVSFSEAVSGFSAADVIVGGTAGAGTVSVAEDEPRYGLRYTVSIAGLSTGGTVSIRVPADAAVSRTSGQGNSESAALDSGVTYAPAPALGRIAAYHGFDLDPAAAPYPPFLHSVTGGFGWSGPWQVQGFVATNYPDGYRLATGSPLSHSNLLAAGGHVEGGRNYESAGRLFDIPGAFGPWQAGGSPTNPVGMSGTELWMSALLRKHSADDAYAAVGLHSGSVPATAIGASKAVIGYMGATCNSAGVRYWSLLVRTDADTSLAAVRSAVPVAIGQPALLVLRVRFGEQDRFDLYVNPASLGDEAPASPDASWTTSGTNDMVFRGVTLSGGPWTNTFAVDELRLGETFAAVTPPRAPGRIQLSASGFSAREGDGAVTLYADRCSGVTGAASVVWRTADGTAVSGADYASATGVLSWADGEGGVQSLVVQLTDDAAIETNETFRVVLDPPLGAVGGTPSTATVTIVNDDFKPFDVWRNSRFSSAQLADAATSGPDADPDGDGLANLAEYALGLDPLVAGRPGQPWCGLVTDGGSRYLAADLFRNEAATDVVFGVTSSSNLVEWLPVAGGAEVVSNEADRVRVRDPVSADGHERRFMKIIVTQP